jgi:hypothetical protein
MFDVIARQRLQAMGFTLYVPAVAQATAVPPPVAAAPVTPSAVVAPPNPFWDSALGRNIRRHAAGVDLAAIVLPSDPVRAKRSLWRAIQAQRRPR